MTATVKAEEVETLGKVLVQVWAHKKMTRTAILHLGSSRRPS